MKRMGKGEKMNINEKKRKNIEKKLKIDINKMCTKR